jgi:NADH dehydrogenase [ubiquinone] 1 alpha subcomplex assembly factor 1
VVSQEGTTGRFSPYPIINFQEPDSVKTCKSFSDKDLGGFTTSALDYIPPSEAGKAKGHARFYGNISIELPKNRPHIQRTGYAAWRTLEPKTTLFGRQLHDIDPYTFLALRVKSDGRKYFINIQTEGLVPTDIHQHRLYARKPGEWETVLVKWHEFVRTNYGEVVEPQGEILRQKVKTVGIGLIDRVPGPFDLSVERIWACNELTAEDLREDGREVEAKKVDDRPPVKGLWAD